MEHTSLMMLAKEKHPLPCCSPQNLQGFWHDPITVIRVHPENILLSGCQYNSMTKYGRATHFLEIPMDYVVRIEVTKAFCDIRSPLMGYTRQQREK